MAQSGCRAGAQRVDCETVLQERGLTQCSFYAWRKRLREGGPVRFALVERGRLGQEAAAEVSLELVLATGERLRIGAGVDGSPCARCWTRCAHDPPAGQRAGVSVPDAVRHAQELRQPARVGARAPAIGCFRRTLVCVRQPAEGSVKILYWDRDGFAVWSKRLEGGTYAVPFGEGEERRREITAQELGALLSGIDLKHATRRRRYQRSV